MGSKSKKLKIPKQAGVDWDAVYEACARSAKGKSRQVDKLVCEDAWRADPSRFGIVKQRALDDHR